MTTEPKHTPGAMNAARALCLPPEWTEAAATIDRETQLPALLADNERLREALRACEAQMTRIECGHDKGPCFGQVIDTARNALSATEKP